MKQPIELRRLRDFGQIINDSFTFLKVNFKPLFRSLLSLCGILIIISTIATIAQYLNMSNVFAVNRFTGGDFNSFSYVISAFLSAFALVLTQSFIHLVTLCYISVYLQKNNTPPSLAEVWGYFRYYFFRVLGSGILVFLLLGIGFILCIIPGIYIMIPIYLVIPIIVMENASFGYALNKSFRLVKNNWWMVFGVIFIMGLIVGVASSIASIPITLITVGNRLLPLKGFRIPLIIIFSILRNVLLLAYVLPAIAISLCYFSLSEEKEGTGLLDRIETIGKKNESEPGLTTEEY